MSLRLLERLRLHAAERPEAVAVGQVWPDEAGQLTWRELSAGASALAQRLRRDLPVGAVVMLCAPNRPAFVSAFLGILEAGMSVFPVAPDLAEAEMTQAAERSKASALIALHGEPRCAGFGSACGLAELRQAASLAAGPRWEPRVDLGRSMLLLSSGTTGTPRIVRRDGVSLDAVSANIAEAVGFTAASRVLAAVPLCHSYGVEHGLLAPVWAGSSVRLCDGFDRGIAWRELASGGVTLFPGVPFMYEMLCAGAGEATPLSSLRCAYSAGGPLPRSVFDAFLKQFRARVAQLYGATEIGSVTFNSPQEEPFDPASVGRAMRGVRVAILDPAFPDTGRPLPAGAEGHVAIGAPSMMSGYLEGEPAPMLDGYFLTGDLGRLDALGRLTVTGRIKLLIDVGGRKVNPLEVEQVIESHPAVGACIVVPMQVSQTLFRLKAIVTPAGKDTPLDMRELRDLARRRLSAYKVPRLFEVRDAFPKSPAGKILRHLVSE